MLSISLPWLFSLSSPSTSFSRTILSIAQHLSQFLSQSPNQYCRFPFLISLSTISLCSALFCLGLVLFLSLSLSLSLSTCLCFSLSVPFHCILISSISWGFLREMLMKPPSPSHTMSEPGYLPIPGNEGVPGRGHGALLFQLLGCRWFPWQWSIDTLYLKSNREGYAHQIKNDLEA